jgi:hypothetical protein
MASFIATIICILLSIYLSNARLSYLLTPTLHHVHLLAILGLSSITWSAHQFHVSLPSFTSQSPDIQILSSRIEPLANYASTYTTVCTLTCSLFHHLSLGLVFIALALSTYLYPASNYNRSLDFLQRSFAPWHAQLSICLAVLGSLSIAFAHSLSLSLYPNLSSAYPTCLSIYCHHQWIGSFLILGSSAHASIQLLRTSSTPITYLQHRHLIITHLIWLNVFLGFHSFALYLHNDTCDALGRPEDIFRDNSIRLYPFINILSCHHPQSYLTR